MQTYGKIFRKVVCGFLVMYMVMMSIFTYSKMIDVEVSYRNEVFVILNNIKDRVMIEYSKKEVEGRDAITHLTQLTDVLTRDVRYTDEFKIYGTTAVFKQEEQVARSGYYLTADYVDWYLEEVDHGDKYINLEKCFEDDELIAFIELVRDIKRKEEELLWIQGEGYVEGDEVFPSCIQVYKINKTYEEDMEGGYWRDEDAVLVKKYYFDIPQGNMAPYSFNDWHLTIPIESAHNNEQEKNKKIDVKTLERYRVLEADMYNWEDVEEGRRFRWEENWNTVRYFVYNDVETETGNYLVRLGLEYEPWTVAIRELKLIYIYSILMVIIMSLVLTYALWQTEKKQQLLEKNRRMLIDAIGHELKTPLGIITAYSEGLKEKIAEEKREYYLDVIIDETSKMNDLILEMLNLSKFESGAYRLKLEQFEINELMKVCLKNKKKLFENQQLKVQLELSDKLEVTADYSCIEKVINNILMNAIHHTPINGKVRVKVDGGRISIENEGTPIPENKINDIWQSFYKVESIENRSGEGTGLGLAIVKQILELHGWCYGAENTQEGVNFWFEVKK